jgi:hypothetical protein
VEVADEGAVPLLESADAAEDEDEVDPDAEVVVPDEDEDDAV